MWSDPVFNVGDEVICLSPSGYDLTLGKSYTVLKPSSGFTWPAYVEVMDDGGKHVVSRANMFTSPCGELT